MTEIKLVKPHTHAGKTYQAGEVLQVNDTDAAFIVRLDIGEEVKPNAKSEQHKRGEQ